MVLALSCGFGLVGLDRFVINPLFPVIARDLRLDYAAIGLVSASLALTWGIAAVFMGRSADRVGTRRVLVAAVLAFSTLVGLTGLARGLGGLLLLRSTMGLAEGTFVPACIVAATRASARQRVGLNVGLLHMAAALFGTVLAPVAATQLLSVLPSWRWIFAAAAVPGFVAAYAISRVLPPEPGLESRKSTHRRAWGEALGHPGIVANAAILSCSLANTTTMGALLPSYLTDHLQLGVEPMGVVLSLQGLGGLVGLAVVPAIGDRLGHHRSAVCAAALQVAGLFALTFAPPDPLLLVGILFSAGLASAGVMAITVGPLTANAVPATLAATATGIVVGSGEIVGGALAPAVAGVMASRIGITIVPTFVLGVAILKLALLGFRTRAVRPGRLALPATTGSAGAPT